MERFTVQLAQLVMVCVEACNALTSVWDKKSIGVICTFLALQVWLPAKAVKWAKNGI